MKEPDPNSAITRRHFARTLALPVGALLLGSSLPAWAKKKKKDEKPSNSSQDDSASPKYESKVLWEFDALDAVNNRKSRLCGYKGNAYRIFLLPGYLTMIAKIPLDGSQVQTAPLRPGHVTGKDPHRYSKHDGPPPGVGLIPGLKIDEKNRPVVTALDHKTGRHSFVLEDGKWTELETSTNSSAGDEEEEPEINPSKLNLPHKIDALDADYLRDTGNLLYEAEVPARLKNSRIKIVLAKPVTTEK